MADLAERDHLLRITWAVIGGSLLAVALLALFQQVAPPPRADAAEACGRSYIVQAGDTLGSISISFDTTVDGILSCNPGIGDANLIFPGQVLAIPNGDRPSSVDLLQIVDKERSLPSGYVPPDLVDLPVGVLAPGIDEWQMRRTVALALVEMIEAAAASGIEMRVTSAFRSFQQQDATFQFWVDMVGQEEAERISARAGHSEHQMGTTADISSAAVGYQAIEEFGGTAAGRWLAEQAWEYGFALSYPAGAEEITGYKYEPWHWRYLGRQHAERWHEGELTLVEYLESLAAIQGDLDCDGDVDANDSLLLLREIAALGIPPCGSHGDVDCGQQVDSVDSLKILRYVAGLPVSQPPSCPAIGSVLSEA
ncbi:MAG: D-alanyl-D-alanine carboxypeptidase family protein [Dehalococcoidia bacterium]